MKRYGKSLDDCGVVGLCSTNERTEMMNDPTKPRLATNRELVRWLIEGNAQIRHSDSDMVYVGWNYKEYEDDLPCSNNVLVRKWSDTDWHEPTVDYLGLKLKREVDNGTVQDMSKERSMQ